MGVPRSPSSSVWGCLALGPWREGGGGGAQTAPSPHNFFSRIPRHPSVVGSQIVCMCCARRPVANHPAFRVVRGCTRARESDPSKYPTHTFSAPRCALEAGEGGGGTRWLGPRPGWSLPLPNCFPTALVTDWNRSGPFCQPPRTASLMAPATPLLPLSPSDAFLPTSPHPPTHPPARSAQGARPAVPWRCGLQCAGAVAYKVYGVIQSRYCRPIVFGDQVFCGSDCNYKTVIVSARDDTTVVLEWRRSPAGTEFTDTRACRSRTCSVFLLGAASRGQPRKRGSALSVMSHSKRE